MEKTFGKHKKNKKDINILSFGEVKKKVNAMYIFRECKSETMKYLTQEMPSC